MSVARTQVPRLGVLWCPHWPVVVAGAGADEAVAVLHANRVVAMSRRAAADGIVVGQRRREAQARCPQVRIAAHDPMREARAFDRVTQAIAALIPRVEVTEPGTITFVARGPARFYGGEQPMLARMIDEITASIAAPGSSLTSVGAIGGGIADGRFAATIAARRSAGTGRPCTVPAGREATAAFLAPLSVRVLGEVAGLAAEVVDLLQRLGVQRLGELAALPSPDVLARFGQPGVFAQRIAAGGDDRLPGTVEPPPGSAVQRDFDEPVHHSDIVVFAARQLADDLVGAQAAQGRVVTRLVVTLQTEHGEHSPTGGSLFDTLRGLSDSYIIGIAPPDADGVRIRALQAGADDVVSTTVNPDELAARCQALLRRPRHLHARWDPLQASVITLGPLTVDLGRKEIRVHERDVPVTRIEFALFEQLCRRPAEVCARVQLLEEVWGPNWVGDTHVVDVHLSNLRRKLQEHAPDMRFIHTVRGIGFRLSNDLVRNEPSTRLLVTA